MALQPARNLPQIQGLQLARVLHEHLTEPVQRTHRLQQLAQLHNGKEGPRCQAECDKLEEQRRIPLVLCKQTRGEGSGTGRTLP